VLVGAFIAAAARYWFGVFPLLRREMRHWRRRAGEISDPLLRRHALATQRDERGNLEGAAAFAVLAPRSHRAQVVRATVAFQVAYDYVDSLSEQPSRDPVANGYRLHLVLLAAVDPTKDHLDYYRHSFACHDDGYLESLADTCRRALMALPSYAAVLDAALRAVERMIVYQSLNHGACASQDNKRALASWAASVTPADTGLRWWETAAGTASSLNVFSLFAAAGRASLNPGETNAVEVAYFPWIGALHVLLDSLVDRAADLQTGHHSLVEHYASAEEAAARIGSIAARAMRATTTVPQASQHALILAAMASFYLSAPSARTSHAGPVAQRVRNAMGAHATPTMAVLRARRGAKRMRAAARSSE
jgi:tetraprenyl-beta-curcumene synthase